MADNYQPTSKPIAQTADPQRVFPDGTPGIIAASICRGTPGDGEGNCPLWDGHIIDATFPLV
jgi:hypothetical protein